MRLTRTTRACMAGVAGLLVLSACANPSEGDDTTKRDGSEQLVDAVKADATIAAMLPAQIEDRGGITVSINADVEPIKFVDENGQIAGLNPDLLRAAGRVLDTTITFQQGSFDAMVPGLKANRYDAIASVADFVERQTDIDFIDYLYNGTAIMTGKDFKRDKVDPADLCGMSVGFGRGTSQQVSLETAAQKCKAEGKPELKVNAYGDPGSAILAVKSGQADAFWGDTPQVRYNVEKNPTFYKVVYETNKSILGIGINKTNPKLRDALQAALLKLVKDGVYDKILKQWGLDGSRYPSMDINSDLKLGG